MKYSDLNSITTISAALQALENVGASIEQIKLQLEFPEGRDNDWKVKARYALKKKQGIRTAICNRLAVMRQHEKESNNRQQMLIDEMRRYFPDAAFAACVHRMQLKAEAKNG